MLAVAHELFYWQGIRGTGVDTVAAEAAVAPTTLYRLFASKDDLIAAYVQRAGDGYRAWFDDAVAAGGPDARGQILAVFDALDEQTQAHLCRGCPFLMALAEMPDPKHDAHRAAVATKQWVRNRFAALARALPADDPERLADELALTMEGVYASVQALGRTGPARRARALAQTLVDRSREG